MEICALLDNIAVVVLCLCGVYPIRIVYCVFSCPSRAHPAK